MKIRINGAFRGQRVTGQQRYATEVAKNLSANLPENVEEKRPGSWWEGTRAKAWLWSQTVGLGRRRGQFLLTLTARGPLFARHHAIVVHDLFVLKHPEWFSRKYAWTHAPIQRLQMRAANTIITVSEPVADEVRAMVGAHKTIVVAPNAPAAVFLRRDRTDAEVNDVLSKYSLTAGRFILTVGSLDPRKNLERLVVAHRRLPPQEREANPLVVVGTTDVAFGNVSVDETAGTKLLGYISDDELACLYSAAKVVAFPTLDEGFGLPAVEALATGARLLVSDIEVMRWVCREYATYVDPLTVQSISEGLLAELRFRPEPASARFDRSQYASSRFSWQETARIIGRALNSAGRQNLS